VSRTEVRYQLLHLETCQRVECGEGFIEQQQLRFAYQCARERDSLCLSPESVAGHTFACDARPTSSRAPIAAARVALERSRPSATFCQTRLELTSRALGRQRCVIEVRAVRPSPVYRGRRASAAEWSCRSRSFQQGDEFPAADPQVEAVERRVFSELTN